MPNRNKIRALNNQKKGVETEHFASDYLQAKGLQLIQRNFHSRYGEIDLIMQSDETLVFVEVRYRKNKTFGGAAASVTRKKQQRIIKTALVYQQRYAPHNNMRFDILAIDGDYSKTQWIQNAFIGF
ncbi:MAG: YraN family protein [Cocleimonas sp.]|nr:YraN family protein [Cocleimonas sp.]